MSTQKEAPTFISKTDDDINNNSVKSEVTNFDFAENFEKQCDKEETLKKFNFELINLKVRDQRAQNKFKTFGDLANYTNRVNADSEEIVKKLSDSEETLDEKLDKDIKPIVLQEDAQNLTCISRNFKIFSSPVVPQSKKSIAKKRFSEFLKSLCILCDICDDQSTQRVIKLNRQEKIVAAIILRKACEFGIKSKKIFPTKIPEQTCSRCFAKIILLHNRFKNKYKPKKIKQETGPIMDQPPHGYHCQCVTCQNQYGDLPVLLKGIEEQHRMQSGELQLDLQHEQQVDLSHSHTLVNLQQPGQTQEQASFQQYSVKYDADYKSFHCPPHFQSPQPHSHYQLSESQMEVHFQPANKTETYLGQASSESSDHRLNIAGQSPFMVNLQGQAQYSSSEVNMSRVQTFTESVHEQDLPTTVQEQHLPTLLQELEDKCQTDLASQPSTSSGIQSQDDKQSKKVMTCVHCDKNFTHKGDFNKHLRKHTKEKPYKCSFCDKTFSHTSNLHRHQRIHSGDKPFRCPYCDKCFNRKDKLESHKNSKFCKNRRSWK